MGYFSQRAFPDCGRGGEVDGGCGVAEELSQLENWRAALLREDKSPSARPRIKKIRNLVWRRFAGFGAGGEDTTEGSRSSGESRHGFECFWHKMKLGFWVLVCLQSILNPVFSPPCAASTAHFPEWEWVWAPIPCRGAWLWMGFWEWGSPKVPPAGKEGFAQGQSILGACYYRK